MFPDSFRHDYWFFNPPARWITIELVLILDFVITESLCRESLP